MATVGYKNYRAFADENPLRLKFGKQFTALLGPNNSGKSSFLLSLYELRAVWQSCVVGNFVGLSRLGAQIQINPYPGISDPNELFHNSNQRPLTIELDISDEFPLKTEQGHLRITRVVLQCNRDDPYHWRPAFFSGDQSVTNAGAGANGFINVNAGLARIQGQIYDCSDLCRVALDLSQALYVGPFRSTISQVSGAYYDIEIGSTFIGTWQNWKSGQNKSQNLAIGSITENIREIFKFDQLEINPLAGGNGLHIWVDRKPYKLTELGAGLAQFIFVFANAAIKKPTYILIDEPELNLHPSMQIAFLTSLASYTKSGVIFATHSVGLARSTADEIYSLRRDRGAALVRPFAATASYAEFLGEMSFSAFQETGYDVVLLVEGVNDVRTMHQLLRLMHKEHRIVVLQLGGNELATGGRELELGEIRRLSKKICALVDSEREKSGDPPHPKRQAFAEICTKLDIPVCVTERRAIENYISDRALKVVFGERFRSLAPFERLADANPAWRKAETWRAARQMSLDEIRGTDVFAFLEQL